MVKAEYVAEHVLGVERKLVYGLCRSERLTKAHRQSRLRAILRATEREVDHPAAECLTKAHKRTEASTAHHEEACRGTRGPDAEAGA